MNTQTWHSIGEASLYCGLPESTLRYYEDVGIITPIARDPESGHRAYTDDDLQALLIISCLSATGMPLAKMKEYMANRKRGREGAPTEIELLRDQKRRLNEERRFLMAREEYVNLKIQYWQAVSDDNDAQATRLGARAEQKVKELSHWHDDQGNETEVTAKLTDITPTTDTTKRKQRPTSSPARARKR
ncbi:MerR family transcriptional regulator [Bifidobacterium sp. ESL0784]|uniref:MerR family transcriptional regulator n=1 Tax=Bifidobacterium sp. ESL0784 TaxID=2983231 RepID=UPI0023F69485|nr:MerR family transcriptional regulator [Bifidobacterium sp. ESL0784]MDF7640634.1 MerR family transcriptional regulator [Bifidobacterium sp. ESL0784]